jgi:hypothetical protein
MAKFNDIPEQGQGVNLPLDTLMLQSFTWEDGQYGPQVKLDFIKEGLEKPRSTWYQCSNKEVAADKQGMWAGNLRQFTGVLDILGDGKALLAEVMDTMPDIPFNDGDKLAKWQKDAITKILDLVVGKEMQVVFCKVEKKDGTGTVSSIPTLKNNNWKLPFGKDPVPNPVLYVTNEPKSIEPQNTVDLPPVEGEDEEWA